MNEKFIASKVYYNKAKEDLDVCEYCKRTGKYNYSISRLYYYIFDLCRAIMVIKYEDSKKHKTLIGNFNKLAINEDKLFDKSYG